MEPVPAPELVTEPVLFRLVPEIVVVAVVVPSEIVRLPVPVMPPLIVVDPVPVDEIVRLLPLRVIAPLKAAAKAAALLPMVSVPAAEVPRLTGFETVNVLASKYAEPPAESPNVIVYADGPKAPLTVVALLTLATAVPFLMATPPVKVLAPVRVRIPVPTLARPPEPLMAALKVVLYVPSTVNKFPLVAIVPAKVMLPEVAVIVLAVTKLIAPAPTLAAVELLL